MKQKKFTLTKRQGITLFTVVMLIMAAVIVFYRNPLADPGEEMMKKVQMADFELVKVWYSLVINCPIKKVNFFK